MHDVDHADKECRCVHFVCPFADAVYDVYLYGRRRLQRPNGFGKSVGKSPNGIAASVVLMVDNLLESSELHDLNSLVAKIYMIPCMLQCSSSLKRAIWAGTVPHANILGCNSAHS